MDERLGRAEPDDAAEAQRCLGVTLLRGIDELVRARTSSRFAALYPAAMHTVAINDGVHVSTAANPSLHRTLQSLLTPAHRWLLFDSELHELRLLEVAAAQEILCNQRPRGSAAAG